MLRAGQRRAGRAGCGSRLSRIFTTYSSPAVGLLHRPATSSSSLRRARDRARVARFGDSSVVERRRCRRRPSRSMRAGLAQLLALARDARLLARVPLVAAHRLGDLGEVARALRRHDDRPRWTDARSVDRRQASRSAAVSAPRRSSSRRAADRLVQRGDAVVVEARGDGAEHRHLVGRLRRTPRGCAAPACARRAARPRALAVELVDGDEVGEVEHVDLLELAGGAELRRHHVERQRRPAARCRVALADARRSRPRSGRSRRALHAAIASGSAAAISRAALARGERAHEDVRMRRSRSCGCGRRAARRRSCGATDRPTMTASRSRSSWSRRKRRTSSSVSERLARTAGAGDAQHRRVTVSARRAVRRARQRTRWRRAGRRSGPVRAR